MDRAARQRLAAETLLHDWSSGLNLPDGPVIVVGSTGSHGATRLFMEAVARLPEGAVVLPGFDFVDFDNDPAETNSGSSSSRGHGTHVAGLVALVAPAAKIMPVLRR